MDIKRFRVRVFVPTELEIFAETRQQAIQKAVETYKNEDKTIQCIFLTASWVKPEVEVVEITDL